MALSSSTQSMAGIFHMGVVGCRNFHIFRNPENLSTVCTRLHIFFTHAQVPRSKAMMDLSSSVYNYQLAFGPKGPEGKLELYE